MQARYKSYKVLSGDIAMPAIAREKMLWNNIYRYEELSYKFEQCVASDHNSGQSWSGRHENLEYSR